MRLTTVSCLAPGLIAVAAAAWAQVPPGMEGMEACMPPEEDPGGADGLCTGAGDPDCIPPDWEPDPSCQALGTWTCPAANPTCMAEVCEAEPQCCIGPDGGNWACNSVQPCSRVRCDLHCGDCVCDPNRDEDKTSCPIDCGYNCGGQHFGYCANSETPACISCDLSSVRPSDYHCVPQGEKCPCGRGHPDGKCERTPGDEQAICTTCGQHYPEPECVEDANRDNHPDCGDCVRSYQQYWDHPDALGVIKMCPELAPYCIDPDRDGWDQCSPCNGHLSTLGNLDCAELKAPVPEGFDHWLKARKKAFREERMQWACKREPCEVRDDSNGACYRNPPPDGPWARRENTSPVYECKKEPCKCDEECCLPARKPVRILGLPSFRIPGFPVPLPFGLSFTGPVSHEVEQEHEGEQEDEEQDHERFGCEAKRTSTFDFKPCLSWGDGAHVFAGELASGVTLEIGPSAEASACAEYRKTKTRVECRTAGCGNDGFFKSCGDPTCSLKAVDRFFVPLSLKASADLGLGELAAQFHRGGDHEDIGVPMVTGRASVSLSASVISHKGYYKYDGAYTLNDEQQIQPICDDMPEMNPANGLGCCGVGAGHRSDAAEDKSYGVRVTASGSASVGFLGVTGATVSIEATYCKAKFETSTHYCDTGLDEGNPEHASGSLTRINLSPPSGSVTKGNRTVAYEVVGDSLVVTTTDLVAGKKRTKTNEHVLTKRSGNSAKACEIFAKVNK